MAKVQIEEEELFRLRVEASILRDVHRSADEHYKSVIGGSSQEPKADAVEKEPRYSGNRVCPICGHRYGLCHFHGFDECDVCRGEAHERYGSLRELLRDEEYLILLPSEDAYVADMLLRMKSGEDKRSPHCVVVNGIPHEILDKDGKCRE